MHKSIANAPGPVSARKGVDGGHKIETGRIYREKSKIMSEEHIREDKKRGDWDEAAKQNFMNWRSWGSWFSWGSPVGLGIWFLCAAAALAIVLSSVGKFIVLMGWVS